MSCRRRRGYRRFSTSAYRLLGDFEVAITGGVWVATGGEELYGLVWSKPMTKVAQQIKVSGATWPGFARFSKCHDPREATWRNWQSERTFPGRVNLMSVVCALPRTIDHLPNMD